jgi:phospholipid/cholesterol/gamma-HCH transport system substrate-binding protein
MKTVGSLWRFGLAALASAIFVTLLANAIRQPVAVTTHTYNAEFTDVSGLHEGADVRVRGGRVGKVESIQLKRANKRSLAAVTFTLDKRFSIVSTSRLAVKFQALTGLRYVDAVNVADGDAGANRITDVPTMMTQPSFDITVLFNGLQPVLTTLSPDDINRFTDNVTGFLAGDGGGLGPMLDSIHKLTEFVADRQHVTETIVSNLATLAQGVRGRAESLTEIIELAGGPIDQALSVLDEFRKSHLYGEAFTGEATRLLAAIGLKPGIDIDTALDKAFTNVYDNLDLVKRVPVIWENIPPPPMAGTPAPCSRGRADLPLPMDVLLNGRKVVLCHQ